jgi:predicted TIM-barrel fold metal-dependent hydrolase
MAKPSQGSVKDSTLIALRARAKISPLYVKLSGAYRLAKVDPVRLAGLLLNELGPSALLWGSDWPCTNHEQFADFEKLIEQVHEWIPSEFLDQIMARNPMQLYWNLN